MRWLIILLLASSCVGGSTVPKPDQDRAVDLVWRQIYGQMRPPPEIEWYHGMTLWAGGPGGFTDAGWKIMLADYNQPDDHFSFLITDFAHELMHERTFERTGGDVDAFHRRGDWNLVDPANWELLSVGKNVN